MFNEPSLESLVEVLDLLNSSLVSVVWTVALFGNATAARRARLVAPQTLLRELSPSLGIGSEPGGICWSRLCAIFLWLVWSVGNVLALLVAGS